MKTTLTDARCEGTTTEEQHAVSPYFARKAWLTRILAALMLIPASPVILLFVLIVRITSPGPGLYRQARTGRDGIEFLIYKLRTMYNDAESVTGPVWCRPNDSRITPVGKILRLFHLDELPQLVNVLRGEMDLVGPRPERPVFISRLARAIPNYHARLQVLPGITGLAQVNLPPDETLDCVRRKLILDGIYIRQASFYLDVRILLCTGLRLLGIRHGRAVRWLGLEMVANLAPAVIPAKNESVAYQPSRVAFHPETDLEAAIQENGTTVAVLNACGNNGLFTEQSEFEENSTVPARRPR